MNNIKLCGEILDDLRFDHEKYGEKFYQTYILVKRDSGAIDILPLIISEKLLYANSLQTGDVINIEGNIRTYNDKTKETNHLKVYVYVENILFDSLEKMDINQIELEGYLCKKMKKRKTPLGRTITDAIIAVNRPCGKSDYIPCVFWGKNANFIDQLDIGVYIKLTGRMQSREYIKNDKINVVYELSVQQLELINEFSRN